MGRQRPAGSAAAHDMSGVMKLVKPPLVTEGFGHLGYPESLALGLGLLELVCTAVYLIPGTMWLTKQLYLYVSRNRRKIANLKVASSQENPEQNAA